MDASATVLALVLAVAGAALVAATGQGTRGAALAGLAVAAAVILGLGPGALLPLAVFVLGAGVLTRLGRDRKALAGTAEPERGRRGSRHVVAKLGLSAILGVAALLGGPARPLALAYAASLAGAFADTAATEVGPLAPTKVYGLKGGRWMPLAHGTPGGISFAGLGASVLGAAAVALAAAVAGLIGGASDVTAATVAGFGASLLESLVAGTSWGRAAGHFGRNGLVSLSAAAAGYAFAAVRGS